MKVGIITMHKVFNYGSALQAYALQKKIEGIVGKDNCYLIDYKYPNTSHVVNKKDNPLKRIVKVLVFELKNLLRFILMYSRNRHFYAFWKQNFNLTRSFNTPDKLKKSNLDFDVFVTGSDQVWNPRYTNNDDIFMCSFAENEKCISYASSIGQSHIDDNLKNIYKTNLSKYSFIGIRDTTCKDELSKLLEKDVNVVCDPTLLLSAADWDCLAGKSEYKEKKNYILLYILKYSFNPYPEIHALIDKVSKKYGLPVYTIYSDPVENKKYGYIPINGASVEDFLCLIKNASFVVTTSFHGTCFSLIYRKNFYSVVADKNKDSRIYDLLTDCGLEDRGIALNEIENISEIEDIEYSDKNTIIEKFVKQSEVYLESALK